MNRMQKSVCSIVVAMVLLAALPLEAGMASRDLFLPAVGRSTGVDGRGFYTTLWVTNMSDESARVTLSFLASGKENATPQRFELDLAGHETKMFPTLGPEVLGGESIIGGLRIQSDKLVTAAATTFGTRAAEPGQRATISFQALPAEAAIVAGTSAIIQGGSYADPTRKKLYLVETRGEALSYAVALAGPAGETLTQKTFNIRPYEQSEIDVERAFTTIPLNAMTLRVRGISGGGGVVAALTETIIETEDATAYEMGMVVDPRRAMVRTTLGWTLLGLALVGGFLIFRRAGIF